MIIRRVTIMVVAIHVGALFLVAAGAPDVWGIEIQLTGSETISELEDTVVDRIDIGVGGLDLVAGLAALAFTGINYLVMILRLPLLLPEMLDQLGIPEFIRTFVLGPLYIVVFLDLIQVFLGDDL